MFDEGSLMCKCGGLLVDPSRNHAVDLKDSLKLSLDSRQPLGVCNSYSG